MKIKSRMLISTGISIVLVLIFGLAVNSTIREVEATNNQCHLSEKILKDVSELDILRGEYLLYGGERAKAQLFTKYRSLGDSIKKAEEEEEEEGGGGTESSAFLDRLNREYTAMNSLLSEFIRIHETDSDAAVPQELEEMVRGQILVRTQEMVSIADRLHGIRDAQRSAALQKLNAGAISIGIVAIILIVNSLLVFRSILNPINKLYRATEYLAKRRFDTRVDIKTQDELEQLGDSFNRTAEALGRLEEEHKQVEAAKTRFIAVSSHELRSPMTPMKASLQMLLQSYFGKLNKKQKDALEIVLRNTNRLDKLIVDILEVSRIEAKRLKIDLVKTNLVKETRAVVAEMNWYMPAKKIRIIPDIGKLPSVETDPDKVMEVLRNLIDNAKKFSPKNSKIFVTVELKDEEVQFSVKDQGIGITAENKKRIFEHFSQLEQTIYRKYQGTGLGLAICKGIVEALGGKIWFESQLGQGSTFYFTIPVKPPSKPGTIKNA